jgi:hypothetical protein
MCHRITCSSCGKPSFEGCGRHVESVLGDVPAAERCRCDEGPPATGLVSMLKKLVGTLTAPRERKRS